MKLLNPEVFRKLYADKDLSEIVKEKKRIETKIATLEAAKNPMMNSSLFQSNSAKTEPETPQEDPIEVKGTGNDEDMLEVNADGVHSEMSLYMAYSKIITEFIHQKNEYMNETEYKSKINTMSMEDLMKTRNKLVDDVNKYYKETNSMRTKSMLMSIPFLKFMVKDKNINENVDIIEVVMKKEEYIEYIDQLIEKEKRKLIEEKKSEIK